MKTRILSSLFILLTVVLDTACYKEESIDAPVKTVDISTDPLDVYIQNNFTDTYGIAVRYKFVDRYVEIGKRVTPPSRDAVIPMLTFLKSYWIDSFTGVPNGEAFFKTHVPAEMVMIGSAIYNGDGTVTLGTADAGARITLTEVNEVDSTSIDWVFTQLSTIFHEFAHIVHQDYGLPPSWQTISPQGYTSLGSWYTLSDEDALERGFVSPYATSTFNEDFAETVSHILFRPDFYYTYMIDETYCADASCEARNAGRAKIREKYNAILTHYKEYTGVDLLQVRALVQAKFN